MTPDGIRSASHVLFVMGIAGAIGLGIQEYVWHLAGWVLALAWIVAGFGLDITAVRAERAHELERVRARPR